MATRATATDAAAPRFHFIGGKGGVGKTTCAGALAITASLAGERVLVASTDPAPSLGDALQVALSSTPRFIRVQRASLAAVEIDAKASLRRWLEKRAPVLEEIAVQGTWLDHEDVANLLRLSIPGIDELAALLEIARLAEGRAFDLIIVDTAPTGHTLRMLGMPDTLLGVAAVFDRMRDKRRTLEEALRGHWQPGAEDALIEEISGTARTLSALLRDASRTQVSWVTLPEPMAIAETRDAVSALNAGGIHVKRVIVNRLTPAPASRCARCLARRSFERRALVTLPPVAEIAVIEARDLEPRSVRALGAIGRELADGIRPEARQRATDRRWMASLPGQRRPAETVVPASARLVFVGGKGGVGKTTCAAAIAVCSARDQPSRRVLLASTDPAHSLADVFGAAVSHSPGPIRGGPSNLHVREIDASAFLSSIRDRYVGAVDRMFDAHGGRSYDLAHDRAVMRSLIDLAPPGLDELVAVLETVDAVSFSPGPYDLVIMDTAPTGHALRLLEMPALLQDWVKALMAMLLKYQQVTGLGELGETLLNLSKGIGRLRSMLADADRCAFVLVTRAAALPRLETSRLLKALRAMNVSTPSVIVNAAGHGTCARCARGALAERREVRAALKDVDGTDVRVLTTAAVIPPPCGVAALHGWGQRSWRSATGYHQVR